MKETLGASTTKNDHRFENAWQGFLVDVKGSAN